jgi:hypothetical protein
VSLRRRVGGRQRARPGASPACRPAGPSPARRWLFSPDPTGRARGHASQTPRGRRSRRRVSLRRRSERRQRASPGASPDRGPARLRSSGAQAPAARASQTARGWRWRSQAPGRRWRAWARPGAKGRGRFPEDRQAIGQAKPMGVKAAGRRFASPVSLRRRPGRRQRASPGAK